MDSLKIPYGLNGAGELVTAKKAHKGNAYQCPCCSITLVHRDGDIRAKHFAHPPASNCSLESILHITAKRLIGEAIESNARGERAISLHNTCQSCDKEFVVELAPGTFSGSQMESRVGEYVCDVVGVRPNGNALGIEILNTHAVDQTKASNLSIHWVELTAEDVIADPLSWHPTQSRLKTSCCKECRAHIDHVIAVADKWGIDRQLYSASRNPSLATYIAATETCFKCKHEIPVFWWRGVPFCEAEPPSPKPGTIKERFSKQYGGKYWANTCAKCGMIQGDNYLFLFDDAPLGGMPLTHGAASNSGAGVKVVSGKSAVSQFMRVIGRQF